MTDLELDETVLLKDKAEIDASPRGVHSTGCTLTSALRAPLRPLLQLRVVAAFAAVV